MALKDLSVSAASNTATPPNGAPEGTFLLGDISDTFRQTLAVIRTLAAADTIAAAATTDLGSKDATFLTLTGTATTISALGTVSAGIYKFVIYNAAHTVNHNGTSLILLGGANRTVAAGDASLFISEGSGNWRELMFADATGYQPLDAELTALAGLTSAANKIPMFSGAGTATLIDFKDEDNMASDSATAVPSQQSVKAYVTASTALDAELSAIASLTSAANKIIRYTGSGTADLLDFKDEANMASNSATAVPSQQSVKAYVDANGGGAYKLVSTTNVTAVANIDFDLQEDIYCEWKFVVDNVIPATDNSKLRFQMGYSGGTSFETAAYTSTVIGRGTMPTSNQIAGADEINEGVGTDAGETASVVLTISSLSSSNAGGFAWRFESSWKDTDGSSRSMIGHGYHSGTTARLWDAVRFLWSSGNFEASGTIKMFALKRAG